MPASDPTAPIIMWSMSPVWGMPSASPFCSKLETWLRMAELPYEVRALDGPPKSRTKKAPYIERPDGSLLADSSQIITALTAEHDVQLDADLTDAERALGLAVQRMVEEHLYFTVVWSRWVDDAGWAITGPAYFASLPAPVRKIIPALIRRKVVQALRGQGMGRMTPAEIEERAGQDFAALSALLGDKAYFLGDEPRSVDASTYAILLGILRAPVPGAIQTAARGHANLVAYVERMAARYWAD